MTRNIRIQHAPIRPRYRVPPDLVPALQRAWQVIDGSPVDITLRLAGDREIRDLNARFRGQRRITDILTFPYVERGRLRGGDLVIGMGRARRQARQRGIRVRDELLRLCVHGLAHLAGFDHHTRADFCRMRAVEFSALLAALARIRKRR